MHNENTQIHKMKASAIISNLKLCDCSLYLYYLRFATAAPRFDPKSGHVGFVVGKVEL
jgi:hypothetical protein